MMTRLLVVAMALAFSIPLRAEWLLSSNIRPHAGCPGGVTLVYLNDSGKAAKHALPEKITVSLHVGGRRQDAEAEVQSCPANSDGSVSSGGFLRWHVKLYLPSDITGPVMVEYVPPALAQAPQAAARTILVVQRAEEPLVRDARLNSDYGRMEVLPSGAREMATLDPFAIEDDPMYFILGGSGGTTAKFQVSVKYPVWRPWNLFIGYSQLSVWDLSEDSKPFRDNNYRPSLFWYEPRVYSLSSANTRVGLRAGFEHESNGRSGLDSRSINTVYMRPELRRELDGERYLEFKPRIYQYVEKEENTDIGRYRGYVDWTLRYGSRDWLLGTTLRRGRSGGSNQLDFAWRLDANWASNPDVGLFVYTQLFNGNGETLLDFNRRRSSQLRVGIGIVR